jgi:hypothetical protein
VAAAVQQLNAFVPPLREADRAAQRWRRWEVLLVAVGRHRVGGRPDRFEARALKRRAKGYPWLTVPRAQARAWLAAVG